MPNAPRPKNKATAIGMKIVGIPEPLKQRHKDYLKEHGVQYYGMTPMFLPDNEKGNNGTKK